MPQKTARDLKEKSEKYSQWLIPNEGVLSGHRTPGNEFFVLSPKHGSTGFATSSS